MNRTFDASEWKLVLYLAGSFWLYLHVVLRQSVKVMNQLEALEVVQAQAQVSAPWQPARPTSLDSALSTHIPAASRQLKVQAGQIYVCLKNAM